MKGHISKEEMPALSDEADTLMDTINIDTSSAFLLMRK